MAEWDVSTLEESTSPTPLADPKLAQEKPESPRQVAESVSPTRPVAEALTQEESKPEAAPLSRPVAESMTRPVAESEGESTPLRKSTRQVAESVSPTRPVSSLFLLEEKAQVNLAQEGSAKDGVWILDSGATSHMTGDRAMFAELDTGVTGTVKFGDGSVVEICGQGTVLFVGRTGEHRAMTGVYLIPRLNAHIISLGQLDENKCQVLIEDGLLRVRERERRLLVKVERGASWLYKLSIRVAQPVCLAALACIDSAWTWHARFGWREAAWCVASLWWST